MFSRASLTRRIPEIVDMGGVTAEHEAIEGHAIGGSRRVIDGQQPRAVVGRDHLAAEHPLQVGERDVDQARGATDDHRQLDRRGSGSRLRRWHEQQPGEPGEPDTTTRARPAGRRGGP